jgi:hypothetical protein
MYNFFCVIFKYVTLSLSVTKRLCFPRYFRIICRPRVRTGIIYMTKSLIVAFVDKSLNFVMCDIVHIEANISSSDCSEVFLTHGFPLS